MTSMRRTFFCVWIISVLAGCSNPLDIWSGLLYRHSELFDRQTRPPLIEQIQSKDSLTLLFFGTSLTYGVSTGSSIVDSAWPVILQRRMQEQWLRKAFTIHNAGVPGLRSSEALGKLGEQSLNRFDIVFVELGTNDATGQIPLSVFRENLERIAELFNDRRYALVFVSPPPALCRYNKPLIEYTRVMEDVAARYQAGFVNINRRLGEYLDDQDWPSELAPDCIHFTQEGYTFWGNTTMEWIVE